MISGTLENLAYVKGLGLEREGISDFSDFRLYIAHSLNYDLSDPILVAGSLGGLEAATKYYLSKVRRYFPLLGKKIPKEVYLTVGSMSLFYWDTVGPEGLKAYRFDFRNFRFSVWSLLSIPEHSLPNGGDHKGSALRPSVVLSEDFDTLHDFRKDMLKYALSLGDDWLFYTEGVG